MLKIILIIISIVFFIIGCGGNESDSGSSNNPSSISALKDIIGYKIVQTVETSKTTGTGSISKSGDTVEYTYKSTSQVLGAGLLT